MKKAGTVAIKGRYASHIPYKSLLLLLSLLLFGCGTSNDGETSETDLEELTKIEVTEYEGQDLSSVTDFRENSIKGSQYIDIDALVLH